MNSFFNDCNAELIGGAEGDRTQASALRTVPDRTVREGKHKKARVSAGQ